MMMAASQSRVSDQNWYGVQSSLLTGVFARVLRALITPDNAFSEGSEISRGSFYFFEIIRKAFGLKPVLCLNTFVK